MLPIYLRRETDFIQCVDDRTKEHLLKHMIYASSLSDLSQASHILNFMVERQLEQK